MSLLQPSNAVGDLEPLAEQLRLIASGEKGVPIQGMMLYRYCCPLGHANIVAGPIE